jgi:hypothetical protein
VRLDVGGKINLVTESDGLEFRLGLPGLLAVLHDAR